MYMHKQHKKLARRQIGKTVVELEEMGEEQDK